MVDEHLPVLYQEVLALLRPVSGGRYIDGTLGGGGHSAGILMASAPDGRVLAFDRDPEAIAFASSKLGSFGNRITFVQASFARMGEVAPEYGFSSVEGILLDLGLSSRQLADPSRGFSFQASGPLDMRFDPGQQTTAADLVNELDEAELADLLWRYGEVRPSRRLARAIVGRRPLANARELAELVAVASPRRGRIHPATQVFQALRIAVNDELGALERGLEATLGLLKPGGRLAVISFHSLEDRMVKRFIRRESRDCVCPLEQPVCTCSAARRLRPVGRRAIKAGAEEVARNPRSRSARLRVAERTTEALA
ncbi:MAG: 16S rRNA (cytosine(1402)-N(4))-methyltransferase RsmH [Candidatus Promineifilaceae bacterium]